MLLCVGPLSPVFPSLPTRLQRIQYVTASTGACRNHAIATQCFIKDIPPASGGIVHAICRFLQPSGKYMADDLLLVAIDTRHHGSHHKTALEEGCFEINVKKISTFACCHLATHPKSWSCGSTVGNPAACLGNLSVPIWLLPLGS